MFTPWDTTKVPKPDFINELGVKWWFDPDTTQWARKKNKNGIALLDVYCFFIEKPDGYRSRVLTRNDVDIYESQSLEAIVQHIDILKFLEQ